MDFDTLFVFGSTRSTTPSFSHSTQIEFPPTASACGCAETSIAFSTRLVAGLIRKTLFSFGQASHSAVSPNVRLPQPAGTRNSPTTAF